MDLSQPLANLTDPCRSCGHTLGAHISHLHDIPEDEINRLLCMVIDVENLFMCVHKEEDADTKQVYFYLFKILRKGILQMSKVIVEGPLGAPPFEKPSIGKVSCIMLRTNPKSQSEEYGRTQRDLACSEAFSERNNEKFFLKLTHAPAMLGRLA